MHACASAPRPCWPCTHTRPCGNVAGPTRILIILALCAGTLRWLQPLLVVIAEALGCCGCWLARLGAALGLCGGLASTGRSSWLASLSCCRRRCSLLAASCYLFSLHTTSTIPLHRCWGLRTGCCVPGQTNPPRTNPPCARQISNARGLRNAWWHLAFGPLRLVASELAGKANCPCRLTHTWGFCTPLGAALGSGALQHVHMCVP